MSKRPNVAMNWPRRVLLGAGAAALLYGIGACSNPPGKLADLATGHMAKLTVTASPKPAPATVFTDLAGRPHTLADFKGKVTVLNVWAKWCAPCVMEIPSLARLQQAYAGKPVAVVPVDLDKGEDIVPAKAFIARNAPLAYYSEPTYALPYALQPSVTDMPTTIIYDKKGVERARLAGGADWSSPEARAVIDALLAE
jgi:thiol-disulfide isomerase/thioredoxin